MIIIRYRGSRFNSIIIEKFRGKKFIKLLYKVDSLDFSFGY